MKPKIKAILDVVAIYAICALFGWIITLIDNTYTPDTTLIFAMVIAIDYFEQKHSGRLFRFDITFDEFMKKLKDYEDNDKD